MNSIMTTLIVNRAVMWWCRIS